MLRSQVMAPPSPPLERYRALLAATATATATAAPARLREPGGGDGEGALPGELELQAAWFAGGFGREFTTTDGRRARVVQFGHWNRSAGPDFVDAVVEIDGEARRGAIEMDLSARGWEAHGHADNPAYDRVALHLFFEPAAGARFFTRTASHREVPQVLLDARTLGDAPRLAEAEARAGRCSAPLAGMPDSDLESLLDGAARQRAARKGAAFTAYAEAHGRDRALFAGVAEALGYRRNRLPMRVLAGRLNLKEVRAKGGEGLLFGAAGFLDEPSYDDAPPETRDYLRSLWESWWKRRDDFDPSRAPHWTFSGSRPSNHPHRRLAALALFAARWPEWRELCWAQPFDARGVRSFAASLTHPYWDRHHTLKSKVAPRPEALVGSARATDLLANIVLPARLASQPELWPVYRQLPAGLGNQKLRRATARLFGRDADRARTLLKRLYAQQALLQIYADFCLADESDCEDCPFPEQLAQWGQ